MRLGVQLCRRRHPRLRRRGLPSAAPAQAPHSCASAAPLNPISTPSLSASIQIKTSKSETSKHKKLPISLHEFVAPSPPQKRRQKEQPQSIRNCRFRYIDFPLFSVLKHHPIALRPKCTWGFSRAGAASPQLRRRRPLSAAPAQPPSIQYPHHPCQRASK